MKGSDRNEVLGQCRDASMCEVSGLEGEIDSVKPLNMSAPVLSSVIPTGRFMTKHRSPR